jgi:hypothetical protein
LKLRRGPRRVAIAFVALVALGLLTWRALLVPAVYFRTAFFIVQRASAMRDRVDWPAVRVEAD